MKTARAVVIDENPKEALHLMQTLAREGIGAVYVAGDNPDYFPQPPLEGIRLVFLDLNLIGQLEARLYVPHSVGVLKSCVAITPRSCGIICWTTHEDEIEYLRAELDRQSVVPSFVLPISDKAGLVERGSDAIGELLRQLGQVLDGQPGHRLLLGWEQFSHIATTQSTDRLVALSAADDDVVNLLAAVAKGAADETPFSKEDTLLAMTAGMASIHQDAAEDVTCTSSIGQACDVVHGRVVQLSTKPRSPDEREQLKRISLSPENKSHINSVLLTTACDALRPGNVYDCGGWFSDDEARRKFKEVFVEEIDAVKSAKVASVVAASMIVAVEITPACDHAANKRSSARFVMGILTPLDGDSLTAEVIGLPAASRQFAKEFESISLKLPESGAVRHCKLVISARHLTTRALDLLAESKPLFRLRHRVVADIQAWFASHAARPGYVSVR